MFLRSLTHWGFISASLKRAAITPVFKSGTKTSPSHCRPISLTSTINKVFEHIIRKQVVVFLTRQCHLNNTQHGFRNGCSCLSGLLDVFNDTTDIFGFSKAFDQVDHDIFLHKLKDVGIIIIIIV